MTTEQDIDDARALADDIEHQIACHADSLPEVARRMAKALVALRHRDDPQWLAERLVESLNALSHDKDVWADLKALLEQSVPCSDQTDAHPYIRVYPVADGPSRLSMLGLLNGLIGPSESVICAVYRNVDGEDTTLESFELKDVSDV